MAVHFPSGIPDEKIRESGREFPTQKKSGSGFTSKGHNPIKNTARRAGKDGAAPIKYRTSSTRQPCINFLRNTPRKAGDNGAWITRKKRRYAVRARQNLCLAFREAVLCTHREPIQALFFEGGLTSSASGTPSPRSSSTCSLGFGVGGLGFGVESSGFGVWGSGVKVQGSGFRV